MNKVNNILTELPTIRGLISWKETVGMDLGILYKNEIYKIKIIDYKNGKLYTDYNGYIYEKGITTGNFKSGKFGGILKLNTGCFKIEIGQIFKDDKRDLVIIDRNCKKDKIDINRKYYKYTCNKCGYEGWTEESHLNRGIGCASCSGQVVTPMNNIWNNQRWMCDLGVSEEDAKSHTRSSNKKVEVICPYCGRKKRMSLNKIFMRKTIHCNCSDCVSYPEKFIHGVLECLNIEFQTQLNKSTFNWCDKYRYDFYIPSLNMIIETHGKQHYEDGGRNSKFNKSLKDEQENDRVKRELAKENGIENYIIIDCRKSELEWIKNSILNSELNKLFDLSKIDWLKCEEFALKNIVKEVCEYWNNKSDEETTTDLAKIFKLSCGTIVLYLKKGAELGWTNYNSKDEMRKSGLNSGLSKSKTVEAFKDGISLGIFKSASNLERESKNLLGTKLFQGQISSVCRGESQQYKGFTFRYVN